MRTPLMAGNWKMYKTAGQTIEFFRICSPLVADAKGVDLGFGVRQSALISGCPEELRMLFGNLIDNAVRYTAPGGSVDVSVRASGASATVEIVDTGCGIPPGNLPHLFDRFFRAASAEVEGSGLGLSIVDAIARRHSLKVEITNRADCTGVRVLVSEF